MRYRLSQIKLNPENVGDEKALRKSLNKALANTLKVSGRKLPEISNIEIIKESIDARKKPAVKLIYTVDFDCEQELPIDKAVPRKYDLEANVRRLGADLDTLSKEGARPVVAGFGPCGMFAGLILAQAGLRPIVIERGKPVDERIKDVEEFWAKAALGSGSDAVPDPESNVQFGEGGAGTFSDGKLTTGIKDVRIRKVMEEFVAAGADKTILYKHRPHLGTDKLRDIVKNIRLEIEKLGGEVDFSTRLDEIHTVNSDGNLKLKEIVTSDGRVIETDHLILATGHSARDTFKMLLDSGVIMEPKPFSIGVRIEHPQSMINRVQYGDEKIAEYVGAADYKLNHKCQSGRGVYTFCMCPGGYVINASTEPGTMVTNGMSNSGRDSEFANSALLVDVKTTDFDDPLDPLSGIEFQRRYEKLAFNNRAKTTYGKFKADPKDPVRQSLPGFAYESMIEAMPYLGEKLKGFDSDESIMTGVETRSSSPVRIPRGESMESNIRGLYPAGEGPGHAGGIMSAAVDGIKAAEAVIREKCQSI